ncbi:hypothetical protein PsAD2_01196 [Pseudovibrio axinellae]|uniref:Uncharacterized protein n=1 Tax=Pseudovibrio axinellae TaxID=989403 RepID=A0A166A7Z7_9HYPH|nr:hypothetical protein [Pseudovibrio axinellae]KZL20708.1 hypothetical protein PsAD2_01196 [Pseudovibrio axinellae]SER25096.1 hypothetical protein SAMN05421798_107181 [Pseudovibrio axinellae]
MDWYSAKRVHNEEGRKKIAALDLECVYNQLTAPVATGGYEWSLKNAREAVNDYRSFLIEALELSFQYDDEREHDARAWPSKAVDIVWHTHILFTAKYFEDCNDIFGHYLHHRPQVPPPVDE